MSVQQAPPEVTAGGGAGAPFDAGGRDRRVLIGLVAVVLVLLAAAAVVLVPKLATSASTSAAPALSRSVSGASSAPASGLTTGTLAAAAAVPPTFHGNVGRDPFAPLVQPPAPAAPSTPASTGVSAPTGLTGTGTGVGTVGAPVTDYVSHGTLTVIYDAAEPSCPAVSRVEVFAGSDTLIDVAALGAGPTYQAGKGASADTSQCTWSYTASFVKGYPTYVFQAVTTVGTAVQPESLPFNASQVSATGPNLFIAVKL
jgi:hypothetical protein